MSDFAHPPPPPFVDVNNAHPTTDSQRGFTNKGGVPPRFAAVVQKLYPYSLRPALIFTSLLGFIWAMAEGIQALRARNNANESSQRQSYDLVLGILFLAVAGIELFGGFVACLHSRRLGKILYILAPIAIIIAVTSQLMVLILHFTLKSDIINQCVLNTVGQAIGDGQGGMTVVTTSRATTICSNGWNQGIWTDVAWLVVTVVAALVFGLIAMAYCCQLADPSIVRQKQTLAQLQAYQMQPPAQNQPRQGYNNDNNNNGQQAWMVPPYPGPPQPQSEQPFEKSDYHPDVEWASAGQPNESYLPPPGAPPLGYTNTTGDRSALGGGGGGSRLAPNREEDEAWERARSEGVTAHLTGHASPPPQTTAQGPRNGGYVIHNDEEDEAWEEARKGGVTAHLTGHGGGSSAL